MRHSHVDSENLTNNRPHNLETVQDRRKVSTNHYELSIGTKPVTLNDTERRNGRVVCVISPNSVAFCAYYVKVVANTHTPIHSASEMLPKESSFQRYITYGDIRRESYPPGKALK